MFTYFSVLISATCCINHDEKNFWSLSRKAELKLYTRYYHSYMEKNQCFLSSTHETLGMVDSIFLHSWVYSSVFGVTKREVHIGPSAWANKQICVIVWLTNKEKSILLGKKWPTKPPQLVDMDIWHLFYFKWMKWGSHFKQEAAQIIGWLW